MNNIYFNSTEIIMLLALMYFVLKYWHKKLIDKYDIDPETRSFVVFFVLQLFTMLAVVWGSVTEHFFVFTEHLHPWKESMSEFWAVIGLQLLLFVAVYIVSALLSYFMMALFFLEGNNLYQEIKEGKTTDAILFGTMTFIIGFMIAWIVIRPFLVQFASDHTGFVPVFGG